MIVEKQRNTNMNTKWYGRDREYDRNGWKFLFKWCYVRRHGNHKSTEQIERKRNKMKRIERERESMGEERK